MYHITEPEVRDQIDGGVYDEELGGVDMVLDVEDIAGVMRDVRGGVTA